MMLPQSIEHCHDVAAALHLLCIPFGDSSPIVDAWSTIPEDQLPERVKALLAHRNHMTSTLREYHGGEIELQVLQAVESREQYCREILLRHAQSGRVVEYGIVRIDLTVTTPDVRQAIEQRKTPLGDILCSHDVMRRIEPIWFLQFDGSSRTMRHFENESAIGAYGRVGVIHCLDKPAIELLEIVPFNKSNTD